MLLGIAATTSHPPLAAKNVAILEVAVGFKMFV
jgi:hypothetical protein